MSYRKKWEKKFGKIPEGYEIHHIKPKFDGGTDDLENLMLVTKEEHSEIHLQRYEEFGNFRDLCAHHMIGYNFTEAHKISSSNGGKIGGKKVYQNKIGIFRDDEERIQWAKLGGKKGSQVQIENKIGIHSQTREERLKLASKGGKASPTFKDPKMQSEFGKRGGKKNKGFIWVNDGKKSYKYTKNKQEEKSIEDFLLENPEYSIGRIRCIKECPYCKKTGNAAAMGKWHFENCKEKK